MSQVMVLILVCCDNDVSIVGEGHVVVLLA